MDYSTSESSDYSEDENEDTSDDDDDCMLVRNSSPNITKDLDKFAQWAFGHDGIKSLQVLAFGDFSYNGRYSKGNMLLCRQANSVRMQRGGLPGKNYRHITKGDRSLRGLLHKYSHALQACPTEGLLEDP